MVAESQSLTTNSKEDIQIIKSCVVVQDSVNGGTRSLYADIDDLASHIATVEETVRGISEYNGEQAKWYATAGLMLADIKSNGDKYVKASEDMQRYVTEGYNQLSSIYSNLSNLYESSDKLITEIGACTNTLSSTRSELSGLRSELGSKIEDLSQLLTVFNTVSGLITDDCTRLQKSLTQYESDIKDLLTTFNTYLHDLRDVTDNDHRILADMRVYVQSVSEHMVDRVTKYRDGMFDLDTRVHEALQVIGEFLSSLNCIKDYKEASLAFENLRTSMNTYAAAFTHMVETTELMNKKFSIIESDFMTLYKGFSEKVSMLYGAVLNDKEANDKLTATIQSLADMNKLFSTIDAVNGTVNSVSHAVEAESAYKSATKIDL